MIYFLLKENFDCDECDATIVHLRSKILEKIKDTDVKDYMQDSLREKVNKNTSVPFSFKFS